MCFETEKNNASNACLKSCPPKGCVGIIAIETSVKLIKKKKLPF